MHLDICLVTREEEGATLSPDRLAESLVDLKQDLGSHLEGFEVKNADEDEDAADVQSAIFQIEALREELDDRGKKVTELELTEYEQVLHRRYHEFLDMGVSTMVAIASLHRVEGTEIFRVRDEFWDFLA